MTPRPPPYFQGFSSILLCQQLCLPATFPELFVPQLTSSAALSSILEAWKALCERIVCPGASGVSQKGPGREKSCSMQEIFTMQGHKNNLPERIHLRMKID